MRTFVISFLATVGVGVPAAWHVLSADVEHDGKKMRPMQQAFTVDGTKITLDVDRNLVITGDAVTASLRAFGPAKQVAIDLDLLQANNATGERVSIPPTQIDHEKLVLTAAPDGGPAVTTKLVLGKKPKALAQTDTFQVYITSHGHKAVVDQDMSDRPSPNYAADVEDGHAAALSILGWSGNSLPIEIKPEGAVTRTKPFVVAVTVANTSGRKLAEVPAPSLATQISRGGFLDTDDEAMWQIERIGEEIGQELDKGERRTTRFKVTPNHATGTQVTFVVQAEAYRSIPGPVVEGAMDVVTFPIAEAPTPTVATAK